MEVAGPSRAVGNLSAGHPGQRLPEASGFADSVSLETGLGRRASAAGEEAELRGEVSEEKIPALSAEV